MFVLCEPVSFGYPKLTASCTNIFRERNWNLASHDISIQQAFTFSVFPDDWHDLSRIISVKKACCETISMSIFDKIYKTGNQRLKKKSMRHLFFISLIKADQALSLLYLRFLC